MKFPERSASSLPAETEQRFSLLMLRFISESRLSSEDDKFSSRCPGWVMNVVFPMSAAHPLVPRERRNSRHAGISDSCHHRTFVSPRMSFEIGP